VVGVRRQDILGFFLGEAASVLAASYHQDASSLTNIITIYFRKFIKFAQKERPGFCTF
jgi:hypothetical protein